MRHFAAIGLLLSHPVLTSAFSGPVNLQALQRRQAATPATIALVVASRAGNSGGRAGSDSKMQQGSFEGGKLLASAFGWLLSVFLLTIYTPMILAMIISLLHTKDVAGMSATTWALQLAGFFIFVIYNVRMGYPVSTYLDFAALSVQATILLTLICVFRNHFFAISLVPIVSLVVAMLVPKAALERLQTASTVVTTGALLPQILKNFAAQSRGGWSPYSAALSTAGNAMRVFTTAKLAGGNPLLLVQFSLNVLTNGILLVQALVWP